MDRAKSFSRALCQVTLKKKIKKKYLGQRNFIIKSSYLAGHLIRYATLREASRFSRFLEEERLRETTSGWNS